MGSRSKETELITNERSQISFNVEEMTNILDGSKKITAARRNYVQQLQSDPTFGDTNVDYMTREERFITGVRRGLRLRNMNLDEADPALLSSISRTGSEHGLGIHRAVFVPTVESLGTEEQVNKWGQLGRNFNIIGTYAQTELGHGSNLRCLETTSTFDKATQEFVVNCPKLTSMKWWPGDLGKCANFVLLMAQLVIDGQQYGMHAFIVQIRDLDTHMPLPGIKIGDIGEKFGFEHTDNGFLFLSNIHIPRENMLARLSEVMPDGSYKVKGDPRGMYGGMLTLRVRIPKFNAVGPLEIACTIATRYSAVRRQGSWNPGEPEVAVLDYVTQQQKIIPSIAMAYAFHFYCAHVDETNSEISENINNGNYEQLPELHAMSAGMKAFITENCLVTTDILRRACGGHGFSKGSGFAYIYPNLMPSVTYEGENTVLYLQTARYLMKCATQVTGGQRIIGAASYLNHARTQKCQVRNAKEICDPKNLVEILRHRASFMINETAAKIRKLKESGQPGHAAWNITSMDLLDASKAHLEYYILHCFSETIPRSGLSSATLRVLLDLCSLYGITAIKKNHGDFLLDGYLTSDQIGMAKEAEITLMTRLRPDAVGLVDAFDFTDKTLRTCIGTYDGNAYERLYEYAKRSPLNKTEVHQETYEMLKPFLHKGRDILRQQSKSKL